MSPAPEYTVSEIEHGRRMIAKARSKSMTLEEAYANLPWLKARGVVKRVPR